MDKKQLLNADVLCRMQLANAIEKFVRENGTMCTQDDIDTFGLTEEEGEILQLYSFYDNRGCNFVEGNLNNALDDINDGNWYDKLYECMTYTQYMCLYIVRKPSGAECLRCYRFFNGGVYLDDANTECDHCDVQRLPLLDLEYIIHALCC